MTPNPDIEGLKVIVWLSGIVISLLLAIVGYFLKQQGEAATALTDAVNQLKTAVEVLQMQGQEKHPVIERRLNEHGNRIDDHDRRLVKLETIHEKSK